jgi:hypothetical protein
MTGAPDGGRLGEMEPPELLIMRFQPVAPSDRDTSFGTWSSVRGSTSNPPNSTGTSMRKSPAARSSASTAAGSRCSCSDWSAWARMGGQARAASTSCWAAGTVIMEGTPSVSAGSQCRSIMRSLSIRRHRLKRLLSTGWEVLEAHRRSGKLLERDLLRAADDPVVVRVRADPEPADPVAFALGQRAAVQPDAC